MINTNANPMTSGNSQQLDQTTASDGVKFQDFPSGNISREDADNYIPIFTEEFLKIEEIFNASEKLVEMCQTKLGEMCETEENKVILTDQNLNRTSTVELLQIYFKSFFAVTLWIILNWMMYLE